MCSDFTKKLENLFNCSPVTYNKVCEEGTVYIHRTLQQNITRFCVQWIVHMGTDWTISTDDRNEASVNLCRDLMKISDAKYLLEHTQIPYI